MLKIYSKVLLISLLVIVSTTIALSQAQDNSPFSRFGLGDFSQTDMPAPHAMGGLGSAYHDFFEANLDNPASLGFLQYTGLQVGFYIKRANLKRNDTSKTIWSGTLDHLSLNIPIINPVNQKLERRETDISWGTSFSLRPYTTVGYFVVVNDALDSIGDIQRTFMGSGGLYQLNWGNGFKYKNLAVGVNLGYIYGKESFTEQTIFGTLGNAYYDLFQSVDKYKGFQYRVGFQYEQPLDLKGARKKNDNPSRLLSFGGFVSGQTTLNIKSDLSKIAINSFINDIDTVLYVRDQEGKAILPFTWGLGGMYRYSAKYRFGIDFQSASWSSYQNDARPATMKNSFKLGGGVAWIPDASSIGSYFNRVEYRAGFYTNTDPRVIEGTQVKAWAVTAGAGFPLVLQRSIAWVQMGIDIGRRTGGDNLRENFIRGKVGIILNDNSWFIRGKYN